MQMPVGKPSLFHNWTWFKGRFAGNHGFSHPKMGVPAHFPSKQSNLPRRPHITGEATPHCEFSPQNTLPHGKQNRLWAWTTFLGCLIFDCCVFGKDLAKSDRIFTESSGCVANKVYLKCTAGTKAKSRLQDLRQKNWVLNKHITVIYDANWWSK